MTSLALYLAWVLADQPAGDALRFPPFVELRAGRTFNQRYQAHLQDRIESGLDTPANVNRLRLALQETKDLYEIWDCIEGAHPDYSCNPELKACYHHRLRLLLGPDAYWRAELPPPVPVWRFNQLR